MREKIINCPIHGPMSMSPLAIAIIDTLEFQRLREIRQLGSGEFVFPGGTVTRFEHSLGTAHLGKKFITTIASRQPELKVSAEEILCVELAGLCHDLGHGPFSHLWEHFFENASKELIGRAIEWHHEKTSVHVLKMLVERNDIFERFPNFGEAQLQLVENLILGRIPDGYKRRFLFQIINNADSGLDVDKWDYFMRDAENLGVKIDFEYEHTLGGLTVLEHDGQLQVCFRDKNYDIIQQAFQNRFKLHKRAYQHHKSKIIDEMVIQALIEMEKSCRTDFWKTTKDIACDNPSVEALEKYLELTDSLVRHLLRKDSPLFRAILTRSTSPLMYRFAGQLREGKDVPEKFREYAQNNTVSLREICLLEINIHMGREDTDPMDLILFHRKGSDKPEHLPNPNKKPQTSERYFIVVLRCSDSEKLASLQKTVEGFERDRELEKS